MRKIMLAVVLFSSLISCRSAYKAIEYKECKNVKINKIGLKNTTMEMNLVFYNPNKYPIDIQKADLEVFINGNSFGKTNQLLNTTLPRLGDATLSLKIDIEMKNLLRNTLSTISSEEVTIRAVGSIKAGRKGFYKTIDVDYSTKQKVGLF